jgi:predicted anti-sigma-YlaC factor YlaD
MNSHLSDADLTDQLLGIPSQTAEAHLRTCPRCRNQLQQLGESIESFRNAAIGWSASQESFFLNPSRREVPPARRASSRLIGVWTAGILFLGVISSAGLYWRHSAVQRQEVTVQVPTASAADSLQTEVDIENDNELLRRVTSEVSEPIPASLRTLQILGASGRSD